MFIEDPREHGLRFNPWKALVVPRPIGWISTLSADGIANLAPFSYFNAVADFPPMVMFAPIGPRPEGGQKDSWCNVLATQEFVVNLVSEPLAHPMNLSSEHLPPDADEFDHAGLEKAPCIKVRPPRVARAPVSLECRLVQALVLPTDAPPIQNNLVIGQVVGIHIADELLVDGQVAIDRYRPLARLGYFDFTVIERGFPLARPDLNPTEVAAELSALLPRGAAGAGPT